jgi:uncharacterized Fe-S cluster-containing radical SAM superfamily protein
MNSRGAAIAPERPLGKFEHPDWTAKGEPRASVPFDRLDTLWINTGTLCNITCAHCYIESSPQNDRLAYISSAETVRYLDEIRDLGLATREIAFTGGEPFMNPEFPAILAETLARGFQVLVLTNAMQPMQRPRIAKALEALPREQRERLLFRVSLDHHTREKHEAERGPGSWARTLTGMDWLHAHGFRLAIAGRTFWGEDEASAKAGYTALVAAQGWAIDVADPGQLTLLPEMDETAAVPEITTSCWGILHKSPSDLMCATSRMVVKRKGAEGPTVLPCTLIPYDTRFDMGSTLAEAEVADGGMFDRGAVKLNHHHCAKFCVLGGGSCSVKS